jgi:hypothetical protein
VLDIAPSSQNGHDANWRRFWLVNDDERIEWEEKDWPIRKVSSAMPLPRHFSVGFEQRLEFRFYPVREVNAVQRDPSPDFKEVIFRLR